jgi:DNA polymerase
MFAYHRVGEGGVARLWREGDPLPYDLIGHLANGVPLAGWNVLGFDRLVWNRILVIKHGFPAVPDDAWRDSMHLAAAANLPRSLEGCANAVGVVHDSSLKDSNRIRRITDANRTPIPATVAEILNSPGRFDAKLVEDLQWLAARCVQDVSMEEGVLVRLPPWPDMEPWLNMPAIDRRINDRGVMIDVPLVQGLARAAAVETARLDREMNSLTGGAVPRTTNIEALKDWLIARGVELPLKAPASDDDDPVDDDDDTDAGAKESKWRLRKSDIADLLSRSDISDDCRTALFMRAEAAKASVRKLKTMLAIADGGRLRGMMTLMGAQATGRWSSGKAQLHNMVRDAFAKDYENIAEQNGLDPKKDKARVRQVALQSLLTAIRVGRTGDPDLIRCMYETTRTDLRGRTRLEGVLPWVSRMMRRTICAPEGYLLLNGDFANIEARIPVWLAGQEETVQAFARGEDLYRVQASPVYGVPPEALTSEQRQIGKVMRLFLGFCGGVNAFIPAAMNYGLVIPREEGQRYVTIFRDTNKTLMDFCDANLSSAALAIQYPGQEFQVPPKGLVSWLVRDGCLLCRLPSGRFLRYWGPRLSQGYWSDGRPKNTLDVTVLVVKGRAVFRRTLWRGLAIENLTQAIAADLLANALKNLDDANIPVTLHVHDSAAAEVAEDRAQDTLPVFKQAMLAAPAWAAGLPLAVDADASARFA